LIALLASIFAVEAKTRLRPRHIFKTREQEKKFVDKVREDLADTGPVTY